MREKFEKLKKEMSQLQEEQKEILGCGKLSALSEEQQLIYCCNNKALGILSYEAYQLLKEENDANQAVIYFEIACQLGFQKAIVEIQYARTKPAQQTINDKDYLKLSADELHTLALCHLLGVGVEQNRANALVLFQYSAQKGYSRSQYNLGFMYSKGFGVKKDEKKAVHWYRLAAEQGHALGQCNLGVMYDYGFGIKENKKEAARLYRQSVEQENNEARTHLSRASKKHHIMAFHLAMLKADGEKIQSLIKETPALIEELTWDLKRAQGNGALQHILAR